MARRRHDDGLMAQADPHLGIYSLRRLEGLGMSRRQAGRAVAEGRLGRIRPGWFHDAAAAPDAVTAVQAGGILTATSASRHRGLWTMDDSWLHVLVPRNASRRLVDPNRRPICLHWAKGTISREQPVAEPLQIVIDAFHCQPRPTVVALADSALNRGLLRQEVLEEALPQLALWCDAASQSGTESIARVGLRRHRLRVRSQFSVSGVGFVDLLVGDRLVIECDSSEFHDGYQSRRDYERDQELMRLGYLVLRLKYEHVVHEWARIEALVMGIVRARRHLWRSGAGARGTLLAL